MRPMRETAISATSGAVITIIVIIIIAGVVYAGTRTSTGNTTSTSTTSLASVPVTSSSATGASTSAYTINVASSPSFGSYLVNSTGYALYYFVPDKVGNSTSPPVSTCTTALDCLGVWPIFYASKVTVPASLNASDFSTFTRSDGANQTAYLGHPLYYYVGDTKPGETTGQGIDANGGYWYVVPISPTASFTTGASSVTSTSSSTSP